MHIDNRKKKVRQWVFLITLNIWQILQYIYIFIFVCVCAYTIPCKSCVYTLQGLTSNI